jgi:hypothetical protein
VVAIWSFFRTKESRPPDLYRLERKIDYLLRHHEIDPKEAETIPLSDEVIALLQAGKKIAAIKKLRQETRMDLREAKEAVEQFQNQGGTT